MMTSFDNSVAGYLMAADVTMDPFDVTMDSLLTENVSIETEQNVTTQLMRYARHRPPVNCYENEIAWTRYVCNVLVALPIALLGIFANSISFLVLWRQKPRLTTTVLLQGLALADTAVLTSMALLYSLRYVAYCGGVLPGYMAVYAYVFRWLYPAAFFFKMSSTWLTVLLTIDRYIAVCHPLQAQRLCTISRAYKHMVALLVVALLCSLPRFFEYNMKSGRFKETWLLSNRLYTVGYGIIIYFMLMYLLPMILLVTLNSRLLCALYSANTYRVTLQQANPQTRANNRSITVVVIIIVGMCVLSDSTGMVSHVLYALKVCFKDTTLDVQRRFLSNVRNIVVCLNCAANFAIYCLCSRNFRLALRGTLTCKDTGNCLQNKTKKRSRSAGPIHYFSVSSRSSSHHGNKHSVSLSSSLYAEPAENAVREMMISPKNVEREIKSKQERNGWITLAPPPQNTHGQ